jgi:hypothetical protein
MFDIGLFAMIRNLIQGLGGFISAFNRAGNAVDQLARAGESSATLMADQIDNSVLTARREFEESITAP